MKQTMFKNKIAAIFCGVIAAAACSANAQSIFIDLITDTTPNGVLNIAAPTGYSYSGADPVAGTYWNTVGRIGMVTNTVASTSYSLYSGLTLVDSLDNSSAATLSVSYYSGTSSSTSRQIPSTASGENAIQVGGVMKQAWRDYYNGNGAYLTFTFSGLAANSPYKFYLEAGTGTSGQGGTITNITGAGTAILSTANTTANSAGAYGSLWTDAGGGNYTLMAQGTTWNEIDVTTDGSGKLSFQTANWAGSGAYFSGFQITPVPEPGTMAILAGGVGMLALIRRFRR